MRSTLVPVLSVWFLPKNTKHDEERLNVFARMYQGIVKTAVTMRWVLVPAYLGGAALIIVSFGPFLGSEIFPKTDTGQFAIRFRAPSGTQVGITEGIARTLLGEELAIRVVATFGNDHGTEAVLFHVGIDLSQELGLIEFDFREQDDDRDTLVGD